MLVPHLALLVRIREAAGDCSATMISVHNRGRVYSCEESSVCATEGCLDPPDRLHLSRSAVACFLYLVMRTFSCDVLA